MTDQNQCTLFQQECQDTTPVAASSPNQNFYLKGEIACSTSTVGSEFYLAFMANRVAQPRNMDLEIWVTQDQEVGGTVVTLEAEGINEQIQVPYKQAVKTTIPYTWKVTDVDRGVTIENKALKLSSDADFVFYGVNKEYFTADAYLGIPTRALGTRYVANCHWPSYYNCEFAFTPTTDGTTITVTLPRRQTTNTGNWARPPGDPEACNLPFQGQSYTNGQSFTVTLNRFQVAQIQDPCDLTGALIESDKPIAVWSGDSRTNIGDSPSRDHQVEELFSVDTWGTDCLAWPTPNRAPGLVDYWALTAAEDGTRITVESNEAGPKYFDLNAGESVRFPANSVNEHARIHSDKKFQAVKYASSAVDNSIPGDPAMTICIPSDQFGFGYTFVTPTGVATTYTNYLSLVTKSGNENGFILDGQPVSGVNWQRFPGSDMLHGFVELDRSRQQFRIEHRVRGTQFEAYIYGSGDRESIAYPTGACIQALGECVRSTMFIADGKDNDCDGVVDEELFDGIDNDFDGEIDEDCYEQAKRPEDRCPDVKTAQACYNDQVQLNCDAGNIKVVSAHYGRLGRAGEMSCGSENVIDSCAGGEIGCGFSDIRGTVALMCDGKQTCSAPANMFHSYSKCPTCSLYAHVQYICANAKEQDHSVLSGANYKASSYLSAMVVSNTCGKSGAAAGMNHSPDKGDEDSTNAVEAWRPAQCDKDSSWLQVDLGSQYKVGWYSISGCRRSDFWTTKFGISYSNDGKEWTRIENADGSLKLFDGNSDAVTAKVCTLFQYNIVARWVRIHPVEYNGYPCAHVDFGHSAEFQGCPSAVAANSNYARGGSVGSGQSATVNCKDGWATSNGLTSYEVKCNNDGAWDGQFADCNNLLHCPDIPSVNGGYATGPSNLPGARITFHCKEGKRLNGADSAVCQQNGAWSAPAPTCE